jgi:hypothetical protein
MERSKALYGIIFALLNVFLVSGPVWFILTSLDIDGTAYSNQVRITANLTFITSYLLGPLHSIWHKEKFQFLGTLIGGAVGFVILFLLMVIYSCGQGVCF